MNILCQTVAAVANDTTRSAWTFNLMLFEIRSTTYNRNVMFAEISDTNYMTYMMNIRGLPVKDLSV